jgi:hypothetical protein
MKQEMDLAFNMKAPTEQEKWKIKSIYDLENGIMAEADRATFQEQNSWASRVSRVLEVPVLGPMVKPMIPFVRTPLNILKQGFVESTGLGSALEAGKTLIENGGNPTATVLALQKKMLADPGETFRIAGQIAVTTTAAAVMYAGVMSGAIVGGGPGRWTGGGRGSAAQRAFDQWLEEHGRSRYSIQVGDLSIPFDRFGEPIAIVLRMVADAGMYSSYADYQDQEHWMAGIAGIMVTGLYQASFLQGLQDVMGILTDPEAANGAKSGRAVQNWLSTQTPFGGFLNYVRRIEDPYKHAYGGASFIEAMRVHEDFYGSVFGRLNDRLPGVGKAPQLIDQITGRPVPITPGGGPNGLNPLQQAIPFLPRGGKGEAGAWSAIFAIKGSYQEKRPDGVRLTNAEQQQYNKYMSEIVIDNKTVAQFISDYARKPEVRQFIEKRAALRSSDKAKITQTLDSAITEYSQAAWYRLVQNNSAVARRATMTEAKKALLRENDLRGAQTVSDGIDELFRAARAGN